MPFPAFGLLLATALSAIILRVDLDEKGGYSFQDHLEFRKTSDVLIYGLCSKENRLLLT
jgi:hypothetical protein